MKPTIAILFMAAAAGLLPNSAHGANLIKNGSFETPVVVAGTFQTFSTGQTFAGWKVVGQTGNVAIVSGTFQSLGYSFPAAGGSHRAI